MLHVTAIYHNPISPPRFSHFDPVYLRPPAPYWKWGFQSLEEMVIFFIKKWRTKGNRKRCFHNEMMMMMMISNLLYSFYNKFKEKKDIWRWTPGDKAVVPATELPFTYRISIALVPATELSLLWRHISPFKNINDVTGATALWRGRRLCYLAFTVIY